MEKLPRMSIKHNHTKVGLCIKKMKEYVFGVYRRNNLCEDEKTWEEKVLGI
jgi:hypothetical protein